MEAMQRAAKKDYPAYLMAMHPQEDSISFYLKLGWVPIGDTFSEAGVIHRLMVYPPENKERLKCLNDPKTPPAILNYLENA